jgi:hypothetical protein
VAHLLKTYFTPAESGRLLDPCAGECTAAVILAQALNCQSWGAELSPVRAALAAEKMERVFNAPWSSCHLPDLQALFADEVVVSNSPMGCPIASSAPLPVPEMPATLSWLDWMTQAGRASKSSGRKRSRQVVNNQIALF